MTNTQKTTIKTAAVMGEGGTTLFLYTGLSDENIKASQINMQQY